MVAWVVLEGLLSGFDSSLLRNYSLLLLLEVFVVFLAFELVVLRLRLEGYRILVIVVVHALVLALLLVGDEVEFQVRKGLSASSLL